MDVSDGDSDADSDYDPNLDPDALAAEEGAAVRPLEGELKNLSTKRRREVDSIFASLLEKERLEYEDRTKKVELIKQMRDDSVAVLKESMDAESFNELVGAGPVKTTQIEEKKGNNKQKDTTSKASPKTKAKSASESKTKAVKAKRGAKKVVGKSKSSTLTAKNNNKKKVDQAAILEQVFGKTMAASILSPFNIDDETGTGAMKKRSRKKPSKEESSTSRESTLPVIERGSDNKALSSEIKNILKKSVAGIAKKRRVTETRRFAGQDVTIERLEMAPVKDQFEEDEKRRQKKAAKAASKGIDDVLETIKGPQTISTVAKSAFDWESHKAKEGLDDELQNASKDGYLGRKDFLNRVDHRTYEKEREERIMKQASGKK